MRFSRLKTYSKGRGTRRHNNYLSGADMTRHLSAVAAQSASECYNFRYEEGVLKRGLGGERPELLNGMKVKSLFVFIKEGEEILLAQDCGGQIYRERGGAMEIVEGLIFDGIARAVNYKFNGLDAAIITSPSDKMAVYDGETFYRVENSPYITSTAMHYERMFATASDNKNMVWFSDDFDPTNWKTNPNNGGFIELLDERGECGKVISHMNYVYIFRRYGISRLTAYGDEQSFNVSHLFVSGGEIFPMTAESAGDEILFLASDGIYCFDGLSARKVYENIAGALKPSDAARAIYYNNAYFLSVILKDGEKAVLEAGAKGKCMISRGICADGGFTKYRQKLLFICGETAYTAENTGRIDGVILCKRWKSAVFDFGYKSRYKIIEKFCIEASCALQVGVTADGVTKYYETAQSDGYSELRLNLRGKKFVFELIAKEMNEDDYIGGFETVYGIIN